MATSNDDNTFIIIGAGLGRTGTLSTRSALNKLGFKCYHFRETILNKGHCETWYHLCEQQFDLFQSSNALSEFEWNKLLKDYKAGVDEPINLFYKELMEYYPNAKIILNIRDDANKWYESRKILYKTLIATDRLWFIKLLWKDFAFSRKLGFSVHRAIFGDDYHNKIKKGKYFCIKTYNEWNENVKQSVPKDKLLIFNVKQGWEPLCKFLDIKEIPNEPFPHLNESGTLQKIETISNALVIAVDAALIAIPLAFGYFYWKKHYK